MHGLWKWSVVGGMTALLLLPLLVASCGEPMDLPGNGGTDGQQGGDGGGDGQTTTVALSEATTQLIASVAEDGSSVTFTESSPDLEALSPGTIISSAPTAAAPNGLLLKVTSINPDGDQVTLQTEPATLEEAVENGTIEITRTLTAADISGGSATAKGVTAGSAKRTAKDEDIGLVLENVVLYDADGDPATTDDQITVTGTITLSPVFELRIVIEDSTLKELTFVNRTTFVMDIAVAGLASVGDLNERVVVATYLMAPITAYVASVPVVITPILSVIVGASGEVQAGLHTAATQEATYVAGLTYDSGGWKPLSDFLTTFVNFESPTVVPPTNVHMYTGHQLEILLYGVPCLDALISGFTDLRADSRSVPWWKYYGGLSAGVGVDFTAVAADIPDHQRTIISYRKLLAEAKPAPPAPPPEPTPTPTPEPTPTPTPEPTPAPTPEPTPTPTPEPTPTPTPEPTPTPTPEPTPTPTPEPTPTPTPEPTPTPTPEPTPTPTPEPTPTPTPEPTPTPTPEPTPTPTPEPTPTPTPEPTPTPTPEPTTPTPEPTPTPQPTPTPTPQPGTPPTADFTGDPTSGCPPLTVSFTDNSAPGSSPITSWEWNFGDDSTGSERFLQNPTHTYEDAGLYTVALTVTTRDGHNTKTRQDYIDVWDCPYFAPPFKDDIVDVAADD